MRPYQILQKLPRPFVTSLMLFLREQERDAYKATIASLASKRKLRPVFIQKKPVTKQIEWATQNLMLKICDDIAEQVSQVWLMKARKEMLTKFLDLLEIEHDGEGAADELPEDLDEEKLNSAIDQLLGEFPPEEVKLYLHLFRRQKNGGWANLDSLLTTDSRISLTGESDAQAVDGTSETATPAQNSDSENSANLTDEPSSLEAATTQAETIANPEEDSAESAEAAEGKSN